MLDIFLDVAFIALAFTGIICFIYVVFFDKSHIGRWEYQNAKLDEILNKLDTLNK